MGKITFLVRKIKKDVKTKNINDESNINISINNSHSSMNINMNNNINEELAIYKNGNNSYYFDSNNDLLKTIKSNNNYDKKSNKISESINNKLKLLYMKLKTINEKQKLKHYKCRVCFCEGNFEGNDPLISPCKCTGSLTYIHLNCLRKWLTSKIVTKTSSVSDIYCYTFKSLECEICKSIIPEIVEYRGKFITLLNFKDIEPPYIILQTMYQYNSQNINPPNFNAIFVISLKIKDYIIIGRANNSDIRLSDVSVSRNHSIISYSNGNFYIDDIGSKFGTLLLIQNNILFLPYNELNIQTGKCHLIFRLTRTFLGCFKCFKNKSYENLSYEDFFTVKDKKVYLQILEAFNNNIVDPIERFSSIYGSESGSENNEININNSEDEKIIEEQKNEEDDEKTEKLDTIIKYDKNENVNVRLIFDNSLNSIEKKKNNQYNMINNENDMTNRSIDKRPTVNINNENNENKLKLPKNIFLKKLNNSYKNENYKNNNLIQNPNESNDIFFHDIKSECYNKKNEVKLNNSSFSILNIMNIIKRKNKNKNTRSSLNIKYNVNFFPLSLNNNKFENTLPNTEREKKNINSKFK